MGRRCAIIIAAALDALGMVIDPDATTHRQRPNIEWLDCRGSSIALG